MRYGIQTPIVSLSGTRPDWEEHAGPKELRTVAQAADRLGYEFLTCSDHLAVPPGLHRGERFYDPLATFSYLAAITQRIRFLSYVLVLPFYHPLELAKRYGTLDHLSDGRLTLGLGVGNLREEFDMLGAPFDDRGQRADDALRALRAALSAREVSYAGEFFTFDDLIVDPHAVQEPVPIWIGGHSRRALHRAVTLGHGWAPAPANFRGPGLDGLRDMLSSVALPAGFDVLFTLAEPLDPITRPDDVQELTERARDAGATVVNLVFRHTSLTHYLEQLDALAELAPLSAGSADPATEPPAPA